LPAPLIPGAELPVYRYACSCCENGDMGPSRGRCLHCAGVGLTNDFAGWKPEELTPTPRPPGSGACGRRRSPLRAPQ
jgi:hypothetical protein